MTLVPLLEEGERVRYQDWPHRGRYALRDRWRDARVLELHRDERPWAYWIAVLEFDDGTTEEVPSYEHLLRHGGLERVR